MRIKNVVCLGLEQPINNFHKNKSRKYGLDIYCKICKKIKRQKLIQENFNKKYDDNNFKICSRCKENKNFNEFPKYSAMKNGLWNTCKICYGIVRKERHKKEPRTDMLIAAKGRSKKNNLQFSLTKEDIIIPLICPVLGIPLFVGSGKRSDNSPTIDRIDNNKGYTKDNIIVISYRANELKRDASLEELEKIYIFYKNIIQE